MFPERAEVRFWMHLDGDAGAFFDGMAAVVVRDPLQRTTAAIRLFNDPGGVSLQVRDDDAWVDSGLVVPRGSWHQVRLLLDQEAGSWSFEVPGVGETSGALVSNRGPASALVFGDVIKDHAVGATSGAGSAYWDDIVVVRGSQAPEVTVETHADDDVVQGDFVLGGRVVDEVTDPIDTMEIKVGEEAWAPIVARSNWTASVSTTDWVDDTKYWLSVRTSDGAEEDIESVLICYRTGSGACSPDAPVVGPELDVGETA